MNKKYGALSSSTNPEQLSATVSGAILSVSALIIFIAGWLGLPIAEGQIAEFAKNAGMAVGSIWFLFGVVRKIVISIQLRWSEYKK